MRNNHNEWRTPLGAHRGGESSMIGMSEINQEMAEQNGTEELAFAKARILQQRYLCNEDELQKIESS